MSRTAASPQRWLMPVGSLVAGVASLRAALYRGRLLRQTRLDGPVLSVGNLSVGGSGKTPMVALLASMLSAEGRPVSILSRGYGGAFRGPCLIVSDGVSVRADAAQAGDEPVMLARALPGVVVAVGRRRDVAGREVERLFGPRVHLLDDGFQHLRLYRDLDLVCVSPRDLDDQPLPAGWLRESRHALDRAGVVLLSSDGASGAPIADLVSRLGAERTFVVRRRVQGIFDENGTAMALPARAYVLSGIARPERLIADVQNAGIEVAGHARFADHHRFRRDEIEEVVRLARERRVDAIVTTEKDQLRLPLMPETPPLRVLRIAAEIEDAPRFKARLLSALEGHR